MAYDAFFQLEGIKGESTRKGFEGQVEISSFNFGVSNPTTIGSMGPGGGAGKASVSSFNFMKYTDASSPLMFQACCQGKHFPKAKVTLHKAGGDAALDYLTYEFEGCYIDSLQWSGHSGGDDRPAENVSVAFGKVTVTYIPQDDKGNKGSPAIGSWDVRKVTK